MFGAKNAGPTEKLWRFRSRDRARASRVRRKAEDPRAKIPVELLVRKETYFAMSSTSRWIR